MTEAQESLLADGPNFAIVPRELTVLEYITSIESTCQQLQQGKAEELRGEIKAILKKTPPSKPNITKEEHQALKQLKKDKNRMVLTADKGVSLVVLDKKTTSRNLKNYFNNQTTRSCHQIQLPNIKTSSYPCLNQLKQGVG